MKRTIATNLIVAALTLTLAWVFHRDGLGWRPWAKVEPTAVPVEPAAPQAGQPEATHDAKADLLAATEPETDAPREAEAVQCAVNSVADADLPSALGSISGSESASAAELRELLVRRWADQNPAAAAAWVAASAVSPWQVAALKQVAIAWADKNLSAAMTWLNTLPEGPGKLAAAIAMAYEASAVNPLAALRLASPLPASSERDELLSYAVKQWAVTDSATSTAWVEQIPDPTLRQHLLAALAISLSANHGTAAATIVAAALQPGAEQNRTAVSIVQNWAQTAPRAAADWIAQFPDTPVRAAATKILLTIWAPRDPQAAGSWLLALPAGPMRDAAAAINAQVLGSLKASATAR